MTLKMAIKPQEKRTRGREEKKRPTKTKPRDFPGGPVVKNPPSNAGNRVQSLVQEDHTWPMHHND